MTDITYVVGVGPYPYRIDGRRLSESEAISVLIEEAGHTFATAQRKLHLVSTAAVRDAGAPKVTAEFARKAYRIQGGEPLSRSQAAHHLIQEWRLTPAEAAQTLDRAQY